jgi:hypothetical protein
VAVSKEHEVMNLPPANVYTCDGWRAPSPHSRTCGGSFFFFVSRINNKKICILFLYFAT